MAAASIYLPSTRGGFVWDDDLHVTNNIITRDHGLWRSWFTVEQPNYWPITWSAFRLQWLWFGNNAAPYHVVNIIVHGVNSVLLWMLLCRIGIPAAAFAALLFAIHPVNVETAAWITQLKTLLSVGFAFASMIMFWDFRTKGHYVRYAAALLFFAVSLLSKPTAVTLPVILCLLIWWKDSAEVRRRALQILPFFILAAVMSAIELWFQTHRAIAGTTVRTDSLPARIAGAGWAVWFYFLKAVFPYPLMPIYPRWKIDTARVVTWLPLLGVMLIMIFALFKRKSWGKTVIVAAGCYIMALLPVLGFFDIFYMRYSYVADHYQYFAIPVVIAAAVAAAVVYLRNDRLRKPLLTGSGVIVAIVLSVLSIREQRAYAGLEVFYRESLRENPQAWLARNNLAQLLLNQKKFAEAMHHLEIAMRVEPTYDAAYASYAAVLAAQGRTDDAVAYLKKTSELVGDVFEPHNRLGETYMKLGRLDDAETEFRRAISLRPDFAGAYDNLGLLELRRGNPTQACAYFEKAISYAPRFALAYEHLADTSARMGKTDEAVAVYRRAISAMPKSPQLRNNLAACLAGAGRIDEAIGNLRQALEVDADFAPTHRNLGALLLQKGKREEARERLATAMKLNPADPETAMLMRQLQQRQD